MALLLYDRVKETTTVTGTGDVGLLGSVPGYLAFAYFLSNGDLTYYCIVDPVANTWEVGVGEFILPSTLKRTGLNAYVIDSSNGGAAVSFTSGTKDIFVTLPASQAVYYNEIGNVGIGTNIPSEKLEVVGNANIQGYATLSGNLFVGPGGTAANTAPIYLTDGAQVLTSPAAGAVEFSELSLYFTGAETCGRGYVPNIQFFRLNVSGTSIGTTSANFFGANSAAELEYGRYEVEAYCWFSKNTVAGTVQASVVLSAAPANLNGVILYSSATGTGTSNQATVIVSTNTTTSFPASASLNASTNHCFIIRLSFNMDTYANLRFNFVNSGAGSALTPLRNSYYKVTRLPDSNTGNFVA
jgi:hypothetical protein